LECDLGVDEVGAALDDFNDGVVDEVLGDFADDFAGLLVLDDLILTSSSNSFTRSRSMFSSGSQVLAEEEYPSHLIRYSILPPRVERLAETS